jgi:hypothetical protein
MEDEERMMIAARLVTICLITASSFLIYGFDFISIYTKYGS